MARQFERWGGNNIEHWHSYHIDRLTRGYLQNKPDIARDQIQEAFGLEDQVNLTIKVWPPEAGTVKINTIEVDTFPWHGVYFNGNPVEVTIQPRPGFNFKYWEALHQFEGPDTRTAISYNFEQGDTLVAFFETNNTGLQAKVWPNPTREQVSVEFALDTIDEVDLTLYDLRGTVVSYRSKQRLSGGIQTLTMPTRDLPEGLYFLHVRSSNLFATKKVLVVGD